MLQDVKLMSQDSFGGNGGLNTLADPLAHKQNESPKCANVIFGEDDSLNKRKGCKKLNTVVTGAAYYGNGLFDYGVAPGVRKLIGSFGTIIYKMDDLDGTFDSLLTGRADTINYPTRVNGYYINTNEAREAPYYYDGVSAMAVLSANATGAKFAGEFQGYMFLANMRDNALRFYYEDINTMFTGDWNSYITLPAEADDEITTGLRLRGNWYYSLRSLWYRISFVGGEEIFSYKDISSSPGAISRTAKVVSIPEVGDVIIYLGWDKKVRVFDGVNNYSVSLKYEKPNKQSNIYLENINQNGLKFSHAIVDKEQSIYRLFISIGGNVTATHRLDINYKTFSCSPHDNQTYLSAAIAEDADGKKYNIVVDYNGSAYILNTGNIDEVPLNNVEIGADGSLSSKESDMITAGGTMVTVFAADNDSIYIGSKVKFNTIALDLRTVASTDVGLSVFYSSDAAGAYTALTVVDGSSGFTKSGIITFTIPSGTDWYLTAKDDGANAFNDTETYYYIKLQRTTNTVATSPTVSKLNIGLSIADNYHSPKFSGKAFSNVKKEQKMSLFFDPIANYNLSFYDRINFNQGWSDISNRPISIPMYNTGDDFAGVDFVIGISTTTGVSKLGSTKDMVKISIDTPVTCNCYQYRLTSNSSTKQCWRLSKMDLSETSLGVGHGGVVSRI